MHIDHGLDIRPSAARAWDPGHTMPKMPKKPKPKTKTKPKTKPKRKLKKSKRKQKMCDDCGEKWPSYSAAAGPGAWCSGCAGRHPGAVGRKQVGRKQKMCDDCGEKRPSYMYSAVAGPGPPVLSGRVLDLC